MQNTAVKTATTLLWVLVGIGILRTVLTFALFDSLLDAYVDDRDATGLPREIIEESAPAYRPIALIFGLLFAAVLAAAAIGVARGRNWARILGIVMGLLIALGGVIALFQPAPIIFPLLGLVTAVVALAAVLFLFKGEVRQYAKSSTR